MRRAQADCASRSLTVETATSVLPEDGVML